MSTSALIPGSAPEPSAASTGPESKIPYTVPLPSGTPKDHTTHTESTTTIFLPKAGAFLNPVQHYNRDMSVAVIRAWNELRKEELEARWRSKLEKRGGKPKKVKKAKKDQAEQIVADEAAHGSETPGEGTPAPTGEAEGEDQPVAGPSSERTFRAPSINILEALAATGLRSIRYAKEIPNVKYVLANDLSPSACEAMRRNVAFNGVGEDSVTATAQTDVQNGSVTSNAAATAGSAEEGATNGQPEDVKSATATTVAEVEEEAEVKDSVGRRPGCKGRVKINEGDACSFMYTHRSPVGPTQRVDVVDLDPYGTAAPFIDAAIGCIADGGLLAITCTDLAVLAGTQYPEKCYSNYGGTNVHAEYTHEAALRLVMHSLATCAARYGRYITPLLSFSIDFYVRLFVRIDTRPEQVKRLASQTGVVFTCNYCQTPVIQPFGKIVEKETAKGAKLSGFKTVAGPTAPNGSSCQECGSTMHLGGPLWLGPLQDPEFAKRVINDIKSQEKEYKTYSRMLGMLTLASQELSDPFFFTANRVAKSMHAPSMPLSRILSALLNGGYKISRSHAQPGAVKTNAPRSFIHDILREDIKSNPVRVDKIAEGSPARTMLAKPMTHTIDFTPHPDASLERSGKETFYQVNPLPNWGPAPRAKSIQVTVTGSDGKRKVEEIEIEAGVIDGENVEIEVDVVDSKRVKLDEGDEEERMNL